MVLVGCLPRSEKMATLSNGATLDLGLAPTKYPNLCPWELMISESQERMTFAVSAEHIEDFLSLADAVVLRLQTLVCLQILVR